jgi:2-keto-4-pentenoate hydratase/2-oxohepta-3-ene-1,7-dioic acid hydratase in catechol pathway
MTQTIAIAPLEEALTFARTGLGDGSRILAVRSYEKGTVSGVDLTDLKLTPDEDPIDLVNRLGFDSLIERVASGAMVSVQSGDLGLPVDLTDQNIGVGTNYPEHAKESAVVGSPFLFPKIVQPTPAWSDIPYGPGLLDYEVEVCLVPLQPLVVGAAVSGGLILGNDVTDRAALMRLVDLKDPKSGKGFTSGKGGPGFMPLGDLFVVPRDLTAFVKTLTLQLSVNGVERQTGPVTDWIWDLEEIVRQCRLKAGVRWAYWGGEASLAVDADGTIPARTVIMAGTPAGTVFQGVPGKDRLAGLVAWVLAGLKPSPLHHVIERYIASARTAKIYLQPGDQVTICMDRMGTLSNRVAASGS